MMKAQDQSEAVQLCDEIADHILATVRLGGPGASWPPELTRAYEKLIRLCGLLEGYQVRFCGTCGEPDGNHRPWCHS